MSAILSLLLVWFVISIPVAFFVGAVFTLGRGGDVPALVDVDVDDVVVDG